jgi:hypothetical protein
MKHTSPETTGGCVAKIAVPMLAFFLSAAIPAISQTRVGDAVVAASTTSLKAPKGVRVLARVPLDGVPVTRMYTQWESGRTYLYLEHTPQQIVAVDITKKNNPLIVDHAPRKIEPERYQELFEGGSIEVSSIWQVHAGVDNIGGRGILSVLQSSHSDDAPLLQAFGSEDSNLVESCRNLVFFASPARLLVIEDARGKGNDRY